MTKPTSRSKRSDQPDADVVWHGPAALRPFLVPLDAVIVDERNVNRGDVPATMRSLKRFGQRYPSVVKRRGRAKRPTIRAGNTRHVAAQQLGWTHMAYVDADDLTEDEARAFAIADNATGRLGHFDDLSLAEELDTLDDDLRLAATFDDETFDALLARLLEADDDDLPDDEPGIVGNVVTFRFGDIVGQVAVEVYHEFAAEYERRRAALGVDVMLEDVIATWLPHADH